MHFMRKYENDDTDTSWHDYFLSSPIRWSSVGGGQQAFEATSV
jgi:hypothetical protein